MAVVATDAENASTADSLSPPQPQQQQAPSSPRTAGAVLVAGYGASSYVLKAYYTPENDAPLALKVFSVFDRSKRGQLARELEALYTADCETIVAFYGAFYREGSIYLALEWMDAGSLKELIGARGPLPEAVCCAVAFQVVWALCYLRLERRLHRDLKPSNVLLHSNGAVKVGDFGLSSEVVRSLAFARTYTGTGRYMSPERILHSQYSFAADVWSLGVMLIEAATGVFPYFLPEAEPGVAAGLDTMSAAGAVAETGAGVVAGAGRAGTGGAGLSLIELYETILESPSPRLPNAGSGGGSWSPEFRAFVDACLHKAPGDRLRCDVLLGSPWFTCHGISCLDAARDAVAEYLATGDAPVAT
jgi:serine/threonine protein kinase